MFKVPVDGDCGSNKVVLWSRHCGQVINLIAMAMPYPAGRQFPQAPSCLPTSIALHSFPLRIATLNGTIASRATAMWLMKSAQYNFACFPFYFCSDNSFSNTLDSLILCPLLSLPLWAACPPCSCLPHLLNANGAVLPILHLCSLSPRTFLHLQFSSPGTFLFNSKLSSRSVWVQF